MTPLATVCQSSITSVPAAGAGDPARTMRNCTLVEAPLRLPDSISAEAAAPPNVRRSTDAAGPGSWLSVTKSAKLLPSSVPPALVPVPLMVPLAPATSSVKAAPLAVPGQ